MAVFVHYIVWCMDDLIRNRYCVLLSCVKVPLQAPTLSDLDEKLRSLPYQVWNELPTSVVLTHSVGAHWLISTFAETPTKISKSANF